MERRRAAARWGGETLVAVLLCAGMSSLTAAAVLGNDDDIAALSTSLVEEFVEIATLPNEEKAARLEAYLAPEFQIVRASGEVLDKAAYVQHPSSVLEATVTDVVATQDGDVLVVSWAMDGVITIDGETSASAAPRLSVFHQDAEGDWRLAAHANFIPPEQDDGD